MTDSPIDNAPPERTSANDKGLESLPLLGQVLVACRAARRYVLTIDLAPLREDLVRACDALEKIVETAEMPDDLSRIRGDGTGHSFANAPLQIARANPSLALERHSLARKAVISALDACAHAFSGSDDVSEERVRTSVQQCVQYIAGDLEISALQVAILVSNDIEQIGFACREGHVTQRQGVGRYVLERLTPCHPFTLQPYVPSGEELYR